MTYKTYDKHSTTLEEGITRYNTGVICGGLMLASDDYGIPEACRRSRLVLTNEEVNEAAAKGGAFRPVSGARGESAADVFMRPEEDGILLGVFNYSLSEERHMDIPVEKLGLSAEECYMVRDLWSKRETEVRDGHIPVSYTHLVDGKETFALTLADEQDSKNAILGMYGMKTYYEKDGQLYWDIRDPLSLIHISERADRGKNV